jgi:HEAT repeat protein
MVHYDSAMAHTTPVDTAISEYLRNADRESADALAATGEAGVRRMVDLYFGLATEPTDGVTGALSLVAAAAPTAFMDAIADKEMSRTLLMILGDVDDPRATVVLSQHLDDQDWISRYHAVNSLVRQSGERSRADVERALADQNLLVRAAAIKAVGQWDPARAISLYTELLDADGLTPALRSEASAAIILLQGQPAAGQE